MFVVDVVVVVIVIVNVFVIVVVAVFFFYVFVGFFLPRYSNLGHASLFKFRSFVL